MNPGLLYTWYDVETRMLECKDNWLPEWSGIDVTVGELVIRMASGQSGELEESTIDKLGTIFQDRFDGKQLTIQLESATVNRNTLQVVLDYEPDIPKIEKRLRPLFREHDFGFWETPSQIKGAPLVIPFYSYKGGVGRTLSMIGMARSILKAGSASSRLLIVDADYEAPGLTWLARSNGGFRDFSMLDALSIVYASDNWREEALPLITERLQQERLRIPVGGRMTENFFIPAFRYPRQLLDFPVRPESLLQRKGHTWVMGDLFLELGKELRVDAVLVDLRAGVSELSAPILFDPRVERVIITSTSSQSIEGTAMVMRQLRNWRNRIHDYKEPTIFLSMVPNDLSRNNIEALFDHLQLDEESKSDTDEDFIDSVADPSSIVELPFSSELVHLASLEDICRRLDGTELGRVIDKARLNIFPNQQSSILNVVDVPGSHDKRRSVLEGLEKFSKNLVYAEKGEGNSFLATVPLRALAQKFSVATPTAVVMGAKGAGKTFTFMQLLKSGSWDQFRARVFGEREVFGSDHRLFALLASRTLEESAKETVRKINDKTKLLLETHHNQFDDSPLGDRIQKAKKEQDSNDELFWRSFWFEQMALSLGIDMKDRDPLLAMNEYLEKNDRQVTFLIDGLEDYFLDVRSPEQNVEKVAIRALCQGVVERLQNLPHRHLGIIVFVRRDIVDAAIPQNFGQFAALHESFELKWSSEEALRLVLWVVEQLRGEETALDWTRLMALNQEEIEKKLVYLWGWKMGNDSAHEAYTASWILAALSDFRGRIQARDVMRLLTYASKYSKMISDGDSDYRSDRLIQVSSIKRAIAPCGEEKIREACEEIPALKPVFDAIRGANPDHKMIPFQRETFSISSADVRLLLDQGIVFEDASYGFYAAEIYRQGLGLRLEKGARPRVVNLLRRALASPGD